MTRTRVLLAALLPLALAGSLLAPATASASIRIPDSYSLPGTNVFPEGITSFLGTFWVTSTTDGTIFRGNALNPRAQVFLPGGRDGRTTAVGLDVSRRGDRLVVAGGGTGQVFVYDTRTGALVRSYSNGLAPGATFINDVAIAPNGDAYVTDSLADQVYRIPAAEIATPGAPGAVLPVFRDLTGTAFAYQPGFNANGIVATRDGRSVVVVQSNTGKLFRIALRGGAVSEVDLGGATVVNGDGLELGSLGTLYVVRNADELVTEVSLTQQASRGRVVSETTDASFGYPTTATVVGPRLLVVNSQFDQQGGTPVQPFTVSSIPTP